MRAKFRIELVTRYPKVRYNDETHRSEPDGEYIEVKAQAVSGNTNRSWSNASPSGELRIVIANPEVQKLFEAGASRAPGKHVYLDFSEAPDDDVAE